MNNDFEPIRKRKALEGKSLAEHFTSLLKPEPKKRQPKKEVVKSFPKGSKGAVRKLAR